jgi:hypothetical protein
VIENRLYPNAIAAALEARHRRLFTQQLWQHLRRNRLVFSVGILFRGGYVLFDVVHGPNQLSMAHFGYFIYHRRVLGEHERAQIDQVAHGSTFLMTRRTGLGAQARQRVRGDLSAVGVRKGDHRIAGVEELLDAQLDDLGILAQRRIRWTRTRSASAGPARAPRSRLL